MLKLPPRMYTLPMAPCVASTRPVKEPVPPIDMLPMLPIEATTRYFGDWALRFLLIALAVTPVRLVFGWAGVGRLRRRTPFEQLHKPSAPEDCSSC